MTSDSSVHGLCWSFCRCCGACSSPCEWSRRAASQQTRATRRLSHYGLLLAVGYFKCSVFFLCVCVCVCASLPQRVLVVFVSRDVTTVDHYQCGLLAENSPAGECRGLAAVREAPLLNLNETGRMLSCASLTIVMGVEPHCCRAPETKCSENASVYCSSVCVCVCV